MRRAVFVGMMALTMTGCATIPAGETRSTEQMLAAAGFHMEVADTPEKVANLETFPPRTITGQRHGATPYYVYADPDGCNCMYVGTEWQYQAYQRLVSKERLADEPAQAWRPWPWL